MNTRATRLLSLLVACLGVAGLTACGNLSNEDLIFLSALPDKATLALKAPGANYGQDRAGSQTQGLGACTDDNLRCLAGSVSTAINTGTFAVLDLVDNIAHGYAPTRRAANLRVWGPVHVLRDNISLRFEIHRVLSADSDQFSYCLHAMRGAFDKELADDITCDTEVDDSGLVRVLYGSYTPSEPQGGARTGSGSLTLDLNAVRGAGMGKVDDQGRLTIDYVQVGGDVHLEVQVREVHEEGTLLPSSADYSYDGKADGSGEMCFVVNADFVAGFIFSSLEQLSICAQWQSCGAGRADATIRGGDLVSTEIFATQCWACELATTYYDDSDDQHPTQGDAASCVFDAPLP
ncbi:MAG: hypothetical protein ABIJ09_14355 [Pseudomonadota bacterium]